MEMKVANPRRGKAKTLNRKKATRKSNAERKRRYYKERESIAKKDVIFLPHQEWGGKAH